MKPQNQTTTSPKFQLVHFLPKKNLLTKSQSPMFSNKKIHVNHLHLRALDLQVTTFLLLRKWFQEFIPNVTLKKAQQLGRFLSQGWGLKQTFWPGVKTENGGEFSTSCPSWGEGIFWWFFRECFLFRFFFWEPFLNGELGKTGNFLNFSNGKFLFVCFFRQHTLPDTDSSSPLKMDDWKTI